MHIKGDWNCDRGKSFFLYHYFSFPGFYPDEIKIRADK